MIELLIIILIEHLICPVIRFTALFITSALPSSPKLIATSWPSAGLSEPLPWQVYFLWGSDPWQCFKPDAWKVLLKEVTVTASQHEGLLLLVQSPLTAGPSINQHVFIEFLLNTQCRAIGPLHAGHFLSTAQGFRAEWRIWINQRP